jgi:pyruvate kinase
MITVEPVIGTAERVSTTYAGLADDVSPGDRLLVDDGKVVLRAEEVSDGDVVCRVLEGGLVSDHKGISLPGVTISLPALTGKDLEDLRFAVSLGVDAIALSFVRAPQEVVRARALLVDAGAPDIALIAKIEKPESVQRLEEIVEVADGIMLARGDLGVEMPFEEVPLVQLEAIALARRHGKPIVVATQMLESMMHRSRPTRAEASDVANAVFEGADALMLSGETSVGEHPIAAVQTMARIARAAERGMHRALPPLGHLAVPQHSSVALAKAAVEVASDVEARALVAFTQSGVTARLLARHRPKVPLIAFTPSALVRRQLALSWGVEAYVTDWVGTTDEMIGQVDAELVRLGRAAAGDVVVLVAGTPPGSGSTTNLLRVHRIGT